MKLTTDTTKSGRIGIYADGEFCFTVPAFIWYAHPLYGCDEADEEDLLRLKASAAAHDAYEKALRLLGRRAHSAWELRTKLRASYGAAAVDGVMERLTQNGLIDDVSFAEALADELMRRKHYAPERIRMELMNRGIAPEIAKNAANGLDIDKKQGIIDIIAKMHLPETMTKKDADRLVRRLLNAGYSMHEIREVVTFSEEEDGEST